MPQFAHVALPVSLDREFTYLVPPEFAMGAVPGVRVLVPFGRQVATGVIVGLADTTDVQGVKPLRDVLDAVPTVSEEMLRLCRWVASYYLAPLGEVLRAAFPHGFSATSTRLVRPLPALTPDRIAELEPRSPKRAAVLTALLSRGPLTSTELEKLAGLKSIRSVLRELEVEGLVETDDVLPRPKARPKIVEVFRLDQVNREALGAALLALPARRKKAVALLTAVQAMLDKGVGAIAPADLLRRAGVSSAVLKEYRGTLLPVERREVLRSAEYGTEEQTMSIVLNDDQRGVLDAIVEGLDSGTARSYLLHGVTGSGKTQVYIEAIRCCLARQRTAIVLVPEIALTPQIVRRFKSHFGEAVGVVHSRMAPGERNDVWRAARNGTIRVVIGPRSAVFAPLRQLGLLVVDEEHESTYKQYDSSPRYHARDVAVVRAQMNQAVVVLGSATPAAESYQNALGGKYTLLRLAHRIDRVPMPGITIVNMAEERKRQYAEFKAGLKKEDRGKFPEFRTSSLSALLREKIADRLTRHEGVILLQNRRGFAPFVECPDCGYAERCDNCQVTLTYHAPHKHLRCHYCGLVREPHTICPQCGGTNIRMLGVGTQRVEEDLARAFPGTRVLRMDMDTTSRVGAHDRILRDFERGAADILLGTQMVAKGLDFARVTLVGVISADTQMLLPDFRATERTFQLLTQVAGRAGRSVLAGEVIVQTLQPDHVCLRHVVDHDTVAFFQEELASREELHYPPFSRLMLVEVRGEDERQVRFLAEDVASYLKGGDETYEVLGPVPALIAKIKNQHRWHLLVKSFKDKDPNGSVVRQRLRAAQNALSGTRKGARLIVDVDPAGML